jgi:hypothetical protein
VFFGAGHDQFLLVSACPRPRRPDLAWKILWLVWLIEDLKDEKKHAKLGDVSNFFDFLSNMSIG